MKLHRLQIENFGIFRDRQVEFAGDGLQLVFGPNEAGKSTLLQLVREMLFGFPHRSPYALADHTGEMAATAEASLSDGRHLTYRRRKGRTNTVVGRFGENDAETVDAVALARLLGGAGAELYQNVFGFSLRELSSGEQSLRGAHLDEALYGGAIGGLANFQRVQQSLQSELDALFAPRGATKTINVLLSEIKETGRRLRDASVKPAVYRQLLQACSEQDDLVKRYRGELDQLRRRQARLARLEEAIPVRLRLLDARRQLGELDVPDDFPTDAEDEFRQTNKRLESLRQDLVAAEAEMTENKDKLDGLVLSPEIVAKEGAVKSLQLEVGRVEDYLRDIPLRRQESQGKREAVQEQMRQLHPQWTVEQLEQFQASLPQREAVGQMAERQQELKLRQAELEPQRPAVVEEIAQLRTRLERPDERDELARLAVLIEQAPRYAADGDQMRQLAQQQIGVDQEIADLRNRLVEPLKLDAERLDAAAAPLEATVIEFRDRVRQAQQALDRASESVEQLGGELAACRDELARFEAEHDVPDQRQLTHQRAQRDEAWRLVRRRYVEGESIDEEIAQWLGAPDASLPDRFEVEVARADQLADQRQRHSEDVARQDQLADAVGRLDARLADATRQRDQRAGELAETQRQWTAVWSDSRIEPLAPEAMLDWLRLLMQYEERCRQQRTLTQQQAELQSHVDAFERQLAATVVDDAPPDHRLALARQRYETVQQAVRARHDAEVELPGLQTRLDGLDADLAELAAQRDALDAQWQRMLVELRLPDDWSIAAVQKVLQGLGEAWQAYQQAQSLDRRADDMQREQEQFDERVALLCRDAAADLADLPAVEAVVQIGERLTAAKQAQWSQKTLSDGYAAAERRAKAKQSQMDALDARIERLREAAGGDSDEQFHRVAADARRQGELGVEIDQLDKQLRFIMSTEDAQAFLDELDQTDRDALAATSAELKQQIERVDASYQEAIEQAALRRQDLAQLDGESAAAELSIELEGQRAHLASAVDRWATLTLARTQIQHAIARFERQHQPELLADVARLLQRMTNGRYVGLQRRLDEQGTLTVEQSDGASKTPDQLSRGTCEQLYLAIRLAYVLHYCRGAEPLPLVMDDVLVNFDDQRAAQTLQVLSEVAQTAQVLLLTCHRSVVDLVAQTLPDVTPVDLGTKKGTFYFLPAGKK